MRVGVGYTALLVDPPELGIEGRCGKCSSGSGGGLALSELSSQCERNEGIRHMATFFWRSQSSMTRKRKTKERLTRTVSKEDSGSRNHCNRNYKTLSEVIQPRLHIKNSSPVHRTPMKTD